MENNKIKKEINDVVNDNLKALEQLFPSAVKDGQLDIKALKEELGDFEEVGNERYELNWAGKQNAKKIVQQGIGNKTLKFVEKDSKNTDTTENIYIEGDNLEVLKLLRQNYYNSIKMIYIDPPYNTGDDLIYKNNFFMDRVESDKAEGILDGFGGILEKNQGSSNRYHANWLNMMYPRLKVAKDLLTKEGCIIIAIDDHELYNLKEISDEIFGEKNYIGTIVTRSNPQGRGKKNLDPVHEYHLIYTKDINEIQDLRIKKDKSKIKFKYLMRSGTNSRKFERPKRFYPILEKNGKLLMISNEEYSQIYSVNKGFDEEFIISLKIKYEKLGYNYILPISKDGEEKVWQRTFERVSSEIKSYIFEKGQIKIPDEEDRTPISLWSEDKYSNVSNGTNTLKKLFEINTTPFDFPKSIYTVKDLISLNTNMKDIILDFFPGSATTAHAVMQLNSEDNGNRKYIMVQLPEITDEKSEAFKAGYKNIAEIGKERIRRAGEKIKQEIEEYNSNLKLGEEPKKVPDIGFKVFKVDDTNIKWYDLENFNEESQYSFDDPDSLDFVLGSNDIDIVYEIMLRQNDIPLSERLEVLTDIGNRTYFYASTYLICLETEITEEMVEKFASLDPLPIKFVFRDSAFKDNISLKDETFRKLRSLIERNSGESKISYRVEFI